MILGYLLSPTLRESVRCVRQSIGNEPAVYDSYSAGAIVSSAFVPVMPPFSQSATSLLFTTVTQLEPSLVPLSSQSCRDTESIVSIYSLS